MKLLLPFDMWEEVKIKKLDGYHGVIQSIRLEGKNVFYNLEYFWEGELKNITLYDFELEKI